LTPEVSGIIILITPDNCGVYNNMKKKILIIDKDKEFISELTDVLEGYIIYEASKGSDAQKILKSLESLDMVIANLILKDNIDGLTLIRKVQNKFPNIKTVLMSVCCLTKKQISILSIDHYFEMPFDPDKFKNIINKLFK
jgi:DNA-binding NtrC family response regulator